MQIVDDGGRHALQVKLPANSIQVSAAFVRLPEPVEDATLTMGVKFVGSFPWGGGGKLPGLGGTSTTSNPPTGGAAPTSGWTARHMWLAPGFGAGSRPAGSALVYTYHPDQSGTYGDNEFLERAFTADRVETVITRVRVNRLGSSDGLLESGLNGETSLTRSAYLWRTTDAPVTHFIWSVFRGGGDLSWAVPSNSWVRFYSFRITTP